MAQALVESRDHLFYYSPRSWRNMMNPGVSLLIESIIGIVAPLVFIGLLRPELLLAPVLFVLSYVVALRGYVRQLNPVAGEQQWRFGEMNAGRSSPRAPTRS